MCDSAPCVALALARSHRLRLHCIHHIRIAEVFKPVRELAHAARRRRAGLDGELATRASMDVTWTTYGFHEQPSLLREPSLSQTLRQVVRNLGAAVAEAAEEGERRGGVLGQVGQLGTVRRRGGRRGDADEERGAGGQHHCDGSERNGKLRPDIPLIRLGERPTHRILPFTQHAPRTPI